jgi:NAD(P)-dependent dehydrogenase (short-subunit alcohol dehydrogenase family)
MPVCLITGANGAVGTGIIKKLFENYDSITIVLACRSIAKAQHTVAEITKESKKDIQECLHILQVDLTDTKSCVSACLEFKERFHQLDFLVLNAGIMKVDGFDLRKGLYDVITRPSFVAKTGGDFMRQSVGDTTPEGYGTVFTANALGHFIMVRCLEPLMIDGCRIVWMSSTTADPELFDIDDWQCIKGKFPYESSKRLCELLSMELSRTLRDRHIHSYVASPGNVLSTLSAGIGGYFLTLTALILMRLFGCSGINITGENAATSTIHILRENIDKLNHQSLYHSEISIFGQKSTSIQRLRFNDDDKAQARYLVKEIDHLLTKLKN